MTISQERREELLDNLRQGMSIRAACALVGISERTYQRWREEDEEWVEASDHAIRFSEPILIARMKALAEEKGDWRAHAWLLERRFPKEWGPRQEIEVNQNIQDGGVGLVLSMIEQTDQRLKQLTEERDNERDATNNTSAAVVNAAPSRED